MTELTFEYAQHTFSTENEIVITARNEKFFFTETFVVNISDPKFLTLALEGIKKIRKHYDAYLTAKGQTFIHKIRDLNVMIDMANKGKRL